MSLALVRQRGQEKINVISLLVKNDKLSPLLIFYIMYSLACLIRPLLVKMKLSMVLDRVRKTLIDSYGLRIMFVPGKTLRLVTDIDGLDLIYSLLLKSYGEDLLSQDDRVVIDIGAHIGAFTVRAAKLIDGVVFSLEPHESNYNVLEKNLALNDLTNVIPLNVAVSTSDGYGKLYLRDGISTGFTLVGMDGKNQQWVTVRTLTLQTLLNENSIKIVDLLKLDIEGHEYRVINDSFPKLKDRIRKIEIEVHSLDDLLKITRILQNCGYNVSWESQGMLGENFLLFAQKSK